MLALLYLGFFHAGLPRCQLIVTKDDIQLDQAASLIQKAISQHIAILVKQKEEGRRCSCSTHRPIEPLFSSFSCFHSSTPGFQYACSRSSIHPGPNNQDDTESRKAADENKTTSPFRRVSGRTHNGCMSIARHERQGGQGPVV